MKATGIVRKVDELGRIVIPKEMRQTMHLESNVPLEIYVEDDRIIFRRYNPTCTFCGSENVTKEFKEKLICDNCIREIAAL